MSESELPMVILVHGAWHGAWCWSTLQAELDTRGVASLAIDLPGHGVSLEPFGDLLSDAAHVSRVLAKIQQPIVLVGHSYGGAVISQAACAATNVKHLVYMTAYVPDVGEGILPMSANMPKARTSLGPAILYGDDGLCTINPDLAAAAFYGRCNANSIPANIARLCAQPVASFGQAVTGAAWNSIESTYIRCTDDEAIHISHQDHMAVRCTHVETLETDHSPFSSMTGATADILERIARG